MPPKPTSIQLTLEAQEYLDALAAHQERSRSKVLERLLARVPPPTELTNSARRARDAHKALEHAKNPEKPPSDA